MNSFKLNATWANNPGANNEIDATIASVAMILEGRNVTSYRTKLGREFQSLRIPTYYIAEWVAENWWPLLYEPRKGDDTLSINEPDSEEFLERHSLLTAQHGFALPMVLFIPIGRAIRVGVIPRSDEYADAEFRARGHGIIPRSDIMAALDRFVSGTVKELDRHSALGTPLHEAWVRVKETAPEEIEFCELVGSLGLCPYFVEDEVCEAIDAFVDTLGSRAARDFCLAATKDDLLGAVRPVSLVKESLHKSKSMSLESVLAVALPPENFGQDSWVRGLTAAMRVASRLGISTADDKGADHIFEHLGIDTSSRIAVHNDSGDHLPFSGAVDRHDVSFQMALFQDREDDRRFAAARSIYLAWVSEQQSSRLVTQAKTRDQQASRQFAAELLVPREYLRSVSEGGVLYDEQVREIAQKRKANRAVVDYQANNAGLSVMWG